MAEKRDYYEVLGLQKGASADEIKTAYRKAAIKWHPDKWVNGSDAEKKTAEENFKEAAEAYSVLSDPDKKANYDRFGHAGAAGGFGGGGFGGFGGFDINDILQSVFGQGFNFGGFGGFDGGERRQTVQKGWDIQTSVRLTLEEIASGAKKEVNIERKEHCPECDGKGAKDAADIKTCPHCNGSGQEQRVMRSLFGQQITYTTCSHCGGTGKMISKPCPRCGGSGLLSRKKTIPIDIPAGVENGMKISVRGEGHAPRGKGINGDLLVVVKEMPHPIFRREGQNLFCTHMISAIDAMLGTTAKVPCLGGKCEVKVEPGTQSGTIVRLRGMGLPAVKGYGSGIGDLYVKFIVWIPRKFKKDEKEMLEKMRDSGSFTPDPNREDKAIFEKMKENF